MLVYAYRHGGATTASLVAVVQLVPAALFAPFAAVVADRHPPVRVLTAAYAAQATAMGATGLVILAGGPAPLAYGCAAVAATLVACTRPTQAALTPPLARSPEQLTATNVVSGWVENTSVLAATAATGVLLDLAGRGSCSSCRPVSVRRLRFWLCRSVAPPLRRRATMGQLHSTRLWQVSARSRGIRALGSSSGCSGLSLSCGGRSTSCSSCSRSTSLPSERRGSGT